MVALAVTKGNHVYGKNRLRRSASTVTDTYPDVCGIHAELDLYRLLGKGLNRSNIYVAGRHESSGSVLNTTRPCLYCAAILDACNVRYVIYYQDGEPVKTTPKELI